MRFSRSLLFVFLGAVLMVQSPGSALACSCMMPESVQQSVDDSSAVFLGTVEKISKTNQWETSVTINVQEEWKGDVSVGADVTVVTANDSAACGYQFTEDAEYLVYAHRNETTGKLGVSLCSSTKTKAEAKDDLAVLADFPQPEQSPACTPYMCKDGTEVARCSEDGHVINYFAAPCMTHGGEVGEIPASFKDVSSDHPNAEAIAYVRTEGIVSGYPDGTFKPDQPINRAEFVKIIVESSLEEGDADCGLTWDTDTNHPMWDVTKRDWFVNYVCRAYMEGIITGYSDGSFKPAANINFVEAAKIIVNGVGMRTSADEIWYKPYVGVLEMEGAIPPTILSFNQYVTRGQMAEMIWRLNNPDPRRESQTYENLSSVRQQHMLFNNEPTDVSFTSPSAWGELIRNTNEEDEGSEYAVFSVLDAFNRYPYGLPMTVNIDVRRTDGDFRWEENCMYDTCTTNDLQKQRADVERTAAMKVDGASVRIIDSYYPPAAVLSREYVFFSGNYRYSVSAVFSLKIYDVEYERRVAAGQQPSISELVSEEIGKEYRDPINRIIELHPQSAADIEAFYLQADEMIRSLQVEVR